MARAENVARSDIMFGDYKIIETVGEGGMGTVYRAHDVALDRIVALKVLKEDLRTNRQICARFQREAEAFASLNHPNIVHIYSVGAVGRIPFLAMEFIDGSTLSTIMKREKRIPWKRTFFIVEQIARALACAHESHIIHRDIKPGNILVDDDDHAFVTDFGIAKVLTAETQLTLDGSRLGTPQYMSPERCMNREITPSSDIYSLGVVTFQMLTGRLPYEASSPVEMIKRIVTDAPKRVSEFRTDIPLDVERLVAYTIEKKPRERPASGAELAELIVRVREGKPLKKDGSGLAESLESFRDSMATPTPSSKRKRKPKTFSQKLRRRWTRLPESTRLSVIGAAVVVVATLTGFQIADLLNRGYAVDEVRAMNRGMESWNRSAVVTEFFEESPGVNLAQINLPFYNISRAVFVGESQVAIQVDSAARDSIGPRSALCIVDVTRKTSWLTISPKRSDDSQTAFTFLGQATAPSGVQRSERMILYTRPIESGDGGFETAIVKTSLAPEASAEPRVLMRASDLFGLSGVAVPSRMGPAVMTSSGDTLITVVSTATGPNDWSLVKFAPGDGEAPGHSILLAGPGPPISWIHAAPGGRTIHYALQPTKNTFELWSVHESFGSASGQMLYKGSGRLPKSGIEPHGRYLAVLQNDRGTTVLRVLDRTSEAEPVSIGPAESVAWHPSGDYLVITAPDRKGKLQIWAVRTKVPHDRVQLTYMSEGTTDLYEISPDGMWAISALRGQATPVMVFTDVSSERLSKLEFLSG